MYRSLAVVILLICSMIGTPTESAEQVKALRMIIVRDRQEAQNLLKQLRHGASFSGLAGSKSTGPERLTWGYSGIVRLDDVQPRLRSVLRKLKPGQISEVLELERKFVIVKVISPKIERYYAAADRAVREGKFDQAVREMKAALRLEKDSVQTHLKLATIYDVAERYQDAIPHLEKARQYAPRVTQIAILRGAVYMRAAIKYQSRDYAQKALQAYTRATELDRRLTPAVSFGKGKVYLLVLKQPEKALRHLEKAVEITPNVAEVYRLLIQAYYDTQRYQKAWQHLRLAQSLGFEFPKLRDALYKVKQRNRR